MRVKRDAARPYAGYVQLPVPLRRLAYRCAYAVLAVYRIIFRPSLSGVKCAFTDADKILLVRHTYGPREWELPGGNMKRREAPAAAASREMHEELGFEVSQWLDRGEVPVTLLGSRGTVHWFRAELHNPEITLDPGEIATARWFVRGELPPNLGPLVGPVLRRAGWAEAGPR
jgi:8-oxo-dGTP pyrophosphatase MutT (NUDIX family)